MADDNTPNTREEQDAAHNPGEAHYEQLVSGRKTASDLSDRESAAAGSDTDYTGTGDDVSKNINNTREKEEAGSWVVGMTNQRGPIRAEKLGRVLLNGMKKKGPIGVLAAIIFGGGGALGFFGFTLLPVGITEHFANDLNDLDAANHRKTVIMFGKKLGGDMSKKMSVCNSAVSIRCKFKTLDSDFVKKFEEQGFKFGEKTTVGNRVGFSHIEFPDGTIVRNVNELNALLRNSVVAASAFNAVYNIKNALFVLGKWYTNLLGKLKLTKAKKIEGDTKEKVDKSYEESVKGEKGTVQTKATPDDPDNDTEEEKRKAAEANNAGNETQNQLNEAITKGQKLKTFALKVSNALAIPQLICLTYNMASYVGTLAKVKKAYMFAAFAMIFLTLAATIKANQATEAETNKAMSILSPAQYPSKVLNPETGQWEDNPDIGENVTDSEAYRVVAYGDQINLLGIAKTLFVAAGFLGIIETIVKTINEHFPGGKTGIKTTCKVVNSTAATAVSFLAAPFITAAMLAIVQVFPIEEWAAGLINMAIDAAAGADITASAIGPTAGNLLFIGTATIMGTAAMRFGLKPGTLGKIKQNMKSSRALLEQEVAMKTYEASKTPLDITNRYSFLGSMSYQLAQFMPSIGHQPAFASIGKVVSAVPGSFKAITKNAQAAYSMPVADYSEKRFSQCQDPVYETFKDKFTPDMFCTIRYVPNLQTDSSSAAMAITTADDMTAVDSIGQATSGVTDIDPDVVAGYLLDRGQIDQTTGQPIAGTDFDKFTKNCTERTEPWGNTSTPIEEQNADMRWYTGEACFDDTEFNKIAYEWPGYCSIQDTMDAQESEGCIKGSGAAGGGGGAPSPAPSGDAKQMALAIAQMAESATGAIKFTDSDTIAGLKKFASSTDDPKTLPLNSCGNPFTLDPALLTAMLTLSNKYNILVNNIGFNDDRDFCDAGQHPKGAAIDINMIEMKSGGKAGPPLNFSPQQLPIITSYANDWIATLAPNRGGVGQLGCGGFRVTPPPGATAINGNLHFEDTCDHLHIDARVR